jgi:hypothetical protein
VHEQLLSHVHAGVVLAADRQRGLGEELRVVVPQLDEARHLCVVLLARAEVRLRDEGDELGERHRHEGRQHELEAAELRLARSVRERSDPLGFGAEVSRELGGVAERLVALARLARHAHADARAVDARPARQSVVLGLHLGEACEDRLAIRVLEARAEPSAHELDAAAKAWAGRREHALEACRIELGGPHEEDVCRERPARHELERDRLLHIRVELRDHGEDLFGARVPRALGEAMEERCVCGLEQAVARDVPAQEVSVAPVHAGLLQDRVALVVGVDLRELRDDRSDLLAGELLERGAAVDRRGLRLGSLLGQRRLGRRCPARGLGVLRGAFGRLRSAFGGLRSAFGSLRSAFGRLRGAFRGLLALLRLGAVVAGEGRDLLGRGLTKGRRERGEARVALHARHEIVEAILPAFFGPRLDARGMQVARALGDERARVDLALDADAHRGLLDRLLAVEALRAARRREVGRGQRPRALLRGFFRARAHRGLEGLAIGDVAIVARHGLLEDGGDLRRRAEGVVPADGKSLGAELARILFPDAELALGDGLVAGSAGRAARWRDFETVFHAAGG